MLCRRRQKVRKRRASRLMAACSAIVCFMKMNAPIMQSFFRNSCREGAHKMLWRFLSFCILYNEKAAFSRAKGAFCPIFTGKMTNCTVFQTKVCARFFVIDCESRYFRFLGFVKLTIVTKRKLTKIAYFSGFLPFFVYFNSVLAHCLDNDTMPCFKYESESFSNIRLHFHEKYAIIELGEIPAGFRPVPDKQTNSEGYS